MSVVVGLITTHHIVLAADTQETAGNQKNLSDSKIFTTSLGICGFVGDAKAQYRIKELLDRNPNPIDIVNWPTEDWGCFYFTADGQGFEIDSPGEVGFFDNRKIVACGTGDQYALGAISGFCLARKITSIETCSLRMLLQMARTAVSAATHWDTRCGGSVESLYLKL